MKIETDDHKKILFRFYSNLLEKETVETMWAIPVDIQKGLYKIDNIPFYVPEIASGDIVFAEYDNDEQRLTYRETIEYSGNSTVQVVLMDKTQDTNTIRDIFKSLGCTTEKYAEGYFVIDIPAAIDYRIIKSKLKELVDKEIIDFAEPCLSDNHRY